MQSSIDLVFRDLILSLTQLGFDFRMEPESLACCLTSAPSHDPWLISLVVQTAPFGLRLCGHLPLHVDPHDADIEAILRRCNDLNRTPFPATYSLDPLGGVASFRVWLPLLPTSGSIPALVGLALELGEIAVQAASRALNLEKGLQVAGKTLQDTSTLSERLLDDDDIPF